MQKLVRDKIPEILMKKRMTLTVKRLRGDELNLALDAKLDEELEEFRVAENKEEMVEEIADIIEVLECIADRLIPDSLSRVKARKQVQNGSFTSGYYIEEVVE